jgi:site-specific DNA-methyltransferase (adenine-specific)
MPELSAEEYRALKADIKENGIIVPITVDGDGRIIDGHHRYKAAQELGIDDPPIQVRDDLNGDAKRSLAWRLNMQRRHVDGTTKKDLIRDRIEQLIERGIDKTDDEVAEEMGCTQQWVSEVRETVVADRIEDTEGAKNTTGCDFSTTVDYATSEQKEDLTKDLIVKNPNKSNREIARSLGVSDPTVGSYRDDLDTLYRPQLRNGDVREVLPSMPSESVDLIVTDPPYGIAFSGNKYQTEKYDELEGDHSPELMASVADDLARVLKSDRHAYVFCRWDTLPAVLESYGQHFNVDTTIVWDKAVHGMGDLEDWAPQHEFIVKCSKGRRELLTEKRQTNLIRQDDVRRTSDPNHHPTQKPTALLETLIDASSAEGEVVFDPFGGVYSSAVAAASMDRRAVSVELDTEFHAKGRDRIKELLQDRDDERTIIEDVEVF